jgi:c-di-GMP-binding flagellar brake protein YcgR
MDISRGGMQLHTEHLVDLGATFNTRFGVYDNRLEQYVTVGAKIEVVHKVYDGTAGGFRIGVRFVSFDGEGEDAYIRHLKELEMQQ